MLEEKENFSELDYSKLDTIFSSPDFEKMKIQMEILAEITNIANQPLDLFEKASSKMISDLLNKSKKAEARLAKLTPQISELLLGGEESDNIRTKKNDVLFRKMVDCRSKQYLSNEYVKALSEMKVVYLYKTVEIIIKSLIHTAYPEKNPKKIDNWQSIEDYFNSIDIDVSNFDGYEEVNELRKTNNNIKHDETINDDKVKKIKEFANESQFTYQNIEDFYNRIKPKIQTFVKSLGEAIIENIDKKFEINTSE